MGKPLVSVIIPTYNEEEAIAGTVERALRAFEGSGFEPYVIIADDASKDRTPEIIDGLQRKFPGKVLAFHRKPPFGFGHAIRDAVEKRAKGEAVAVMMGDLSDDPAYIPLMARKITGGGCDVVFGSRFVSGSRLSGYGIAKYAANRSFNNALRLLFLIPFTDTSNAFKVYRRSKLAGMKLESAGFEITVELPMKVLFSGGRGCEIPVSWANRERGAAKWRLWSAFVRYSGMLIRLFALRYLGIGK